MRFIPVVLALLLASGCDFWTRDIFMNDMDVARQACAQRDWALAERVLERYLRAEQDSEKRWQAWNLYLEAVNAGTQEPRASLECLEAMLAEYDDSDEKLAVIYAQIGQCQAALGHYDAAAIAWNAYADLAGLSVEKRIYGLRQVAACQIRQRHFDAAEATLQQCLGLPAPEKEKVWCMLDLADTGMSREEWPEVADICQQVLDTEPEREVAGLAGYMRGDALEQMGELAQALAQFEEARDMHPNPAVMDNRIAWLKKQIKAKAK